MERLLDITTKALSMSFYHWEGIPKLIAVLVAIAIATAILSSLQKKHYVSRCTDLLTDDGLAIIHAIRTTPNGSTFRIKISGHLDDTYVWRLSVLDRLSQFLGKGITFLFAVVPNSNEKVSKDRNSSDLLFYKYLDEHLPKSGTTNLREVSIEELDDPNGITIGFSPMTDEEIKRFKGAFHAVWGNNTRNHLKNSKTETDFRKDVYRLLALVEGTTNVIRLFFPDIVKEIKKNKTLDADLICDGELKNILIQVGADFLLRYIRKAIEALKKKDPNSHPFLHLTDDEILEYLKDPDCRDLWKSLFDEAYELTGDPYFKTNARVMLIQFLESGKFSIEVTDLLLEILIGDDLLVYERMSPDYEKGTFVSDPNGKFDVVVGMKIPTDELVRRIVDTIAFVASLSDAKR